MRTVVVGASPNPWRYSYKAVMNLLGKGHQVVALGLRPGYIGEHEILDIRKKPAIEEVDTITVYVSEKNLEGWEDYIIGLNPQRIIFNPGAENTRLSQEASSKGIQIVNDCTLVMLNLGVYDQ